MSNKLTTEDFIRKSKLIHKDNYDYSLVDYKNSSEKVKIICKHHNTFEQLPFNHLSGKGCKFCSLNVRNTTKDFIEKAKKIHGNKYDYSLVDYKNNHTKIKIICPDHGIIEQIPYNHLLNDGLKCCDIQKRTYTTEIFINKSKKVHYNKYNYSLTNYVHNTIPVIITCPIHGDFKQKPKYHLKGKGCPVCNSSKGEIKIRKFLEENKINFISQHRFRYCKNIKPLPFDFYLPDYNTCIEYDGEQHFNPISKFGGEVELELLKVRDQIKNQYCLNNNIGLIRIKYEDNIEDILSPYFLKIH